ncbi:MAG TPA: LON peptidase substrate-binding domain-containing protein [Thermoanaerobaculia bacterium]|jgi:hypothetical protein
MSGRRLVRLFPLPNVVLLPGTTMPLHVFEPRYRRMLADALDSDRLIGMQLLKPGDSGDGAFRYRIDSEPFTDGWISCRRSGVPPETPAGTDSRRPP